MRLRVKYSSMKDTRLFPAPMEIYPNTGRFTTQKIMSAKVKQEESPAHSSAVTGKN